MLVNGDAGVITVSAELPTRQRRAELRQATEEVLALSPLDFVSGFTVEDAPPPPPRVEVEELQEELDVLIEGKVVEFALNSDRLTGRGERLLNEILEALRIWPDVPVEIAGHADAQGADDLNLELSQRRADAVLAYLVENGEDPERFQVIGYGETRPIADNATEEGRARNRRIEFVALID
jgi:OOP family OmpA-OmpF porin